MSCSGENVNKQRNRYPLHFWKTNGVLFEHYEFKKEISISCCKQDEFIEFKLHFLSFLLLS